MALACGAQDWPGWRGPGRDGVVTATLPKAWPEQLKQVWKVTVGEGHSSPVVVGGRVYQFARQQDNEVVAAFDLATGKPLWQDSYAAPYEMNSAARRHGKGPKSTPLVSGGRLYTFGIHGILSSYDAATGKLRWRKDFKSSPLYGAAASPLGDRGMMILHVGGDGGGALTAFDGETGAVKWEWKGDGPSYASPVIVEIGGTRQVVTQSERNIIGVEAATGQLLWKIPFTTPFVQNIVTPLVVKDVLIFSGLRNPAMGVRLSKQGNQWTAEKLWETSEATMYMNSPVASGETVFGMTNRNRGQFFALEARTGKMLWTGEERQGDNAAMLITGDTVLALTTDAVLIVSRAGAKGLETIRKYTVADSPTWAHPVVTAQGILIKDATALALVK